MAKRKFQIDRLIVNSPYEEPAEYWGYDRSVRMFERKEGRRPAGYVVATPGSKAFDDHGQTHGQMVAARGAESRGSLDSNEDTV